MTRSVHVYAGKCVTRNDSGLTPITLERLYEKIKNPGAELVTTLDRLRTLQTINLTAYREEKKQLPFFTCGSFSPPIRHTKNFGSIACFVLDVDHLSEKELSVEEAKIQVKGDPRVALAFASPGFDGLKIILTLDEACYDASLFSLFYRQFAVAFAREHGFEQVVDKRTSDVTRACFFSYDPDAVFNSEPEPIKLEAWVNPENELSLNEQLAETKKNEYPAKTGETMEQRGPDSDALSLIRAKLNPSTKNVPDKNVYVPEELGPVTDEISRRVEEFNMVLSDVKNIQYGRKLKFMAGQLWAELNIFYGKKGFSVVCSPKRGSNQELAELARDVVWQIMSEMDAFRFSEAYNAMGHEQK